MEEQWKDIPDYEGLYQASTMGRIRTCDGKTTFTERHGVRHWKQRTLKPTYTQSGYIVNLWKDGKPKLLLVARLIATTFLDNLIQSDMTVNHKNGNRSDNRLENLEWVSRADNIRHGFNTELYSIMKKCTLKSPSEEVSFKSYADASRYLGRNKECLSTALQRGRKTVTSFNGTVYEVEIPTQKE